MTLLEDLNKAMPSGCPLCNYIANQADPATKQALTDAAAGSIGRDTLAKILRAHDTGIGQRTIVRHRREDHTP